MLEQNELLGNALTQRERFARAKCATWERAETAGLRFSRAKCATRERVDSGRDLLEQSALLGNALVQRFPTHLVRKALGSERDVA